MHKPCTKGKHDFICSYCASIEPLLSLVLEKNSHSIEPLLCQVKDPLFCIYCAFIVPLLSLVLKQIRFLLSLYCAK